MSALRGEVVTIDGVAYVKISEVNEVIYAAERAARADERERAAERVEAIGQQHPKWDLMSTHYEGCWKHHSECALTLALAAIRTP